MTAHNVNETDPVVSTRLKKNQLRKLDARAKKKGVTRFEFVRRLLLRSIARSS